MGCDPSVVVIGGGLIGLSAAWRLARQGCRVTVIDAAAEAREASWAAAGMLAPANEADEPGSLFTLLQAGLRAWPAFLAELGVSLETVDYHESGSLDPALDQAGLAARGEVAERLRGLGLDARLLDASALRAAEPNLDRELPGALWLPAGQVDPRRLLPVLRERLQALGARLLPQHLVAGLDAQGVELADGRHVSADVVLLAAGAWSPALADLVKLPLPGTPVKGQMLRMEAPDGLLRSFLHGEQAYVVPRAGQGVVIGATMVEAGFDRSQDQLSIENLAAGARRLVPALRGAAICETWTGLRPRLADGLPCMDRISDRLVVATGHFRNGILLTPLTASCCESLVLGLPAPIDLAPYSAARFGAAQHG